MLERPFRFLHTADLHIDRPAVGADDAPAELVDRFVDCGRLAATRIFDAVLAQRVDFVVLAGDVIESKYAAPRDWLFLVEQFQRLAERNIAVYWCGGTVDWQRGWPAFVEWPANVRLFPAGQLERYRHTIGGQVVCEIVGRACDPSGSPKAYEFTPSDERVFSIAVAHADWNCASLAEMEIDYWASAVSISERRPWMPVAWRITRGRRRGDRRRRLAHTAARWWRSMNCGELA